MKCQKARNCETREYRPTTQLEAPLSNLSPIQVSFASNKNWPVRSPAFLPVS